MVCDWCNVEIEDGWDGNYEFFIDELRRPSAAEIRFTYKRRCRPFEQAHAARGHWRWATLTCPPVYLGNNPRLDWVQAGEMAGIP